MFNLIGSTDGKPFTPEEFNAIEPLDSNMTVNELVRYLAEHYQLGGARPSVKARINETVGHIAPLMSPKNLIGTADVVETHFFRAHLSHRTRLVLALLLRDLILPGVNGELPSEPAADSKPARVKKGSA